MITVSEKNRIYLIFEIFLRQSAMFAKKHCTLDGALRKPDHVRFGFNSLARALTYRSLMRSLYSMFSCSLAATLRFLGSSSLFLRLRFLFRPFFSTLRTEEIYGG